MLLKVNLSIFTYTIFPSTVASLILYANFGFVVYNTTSTNPSSILHGLYNLNVISEPLYILILFDFS